MADPPLVEICGLQRREDILLADELGADFLGFVLSSGFSRTVRLLEARALVEGVRSPKVAVLVDENLENSISAAEEIGAAVVQLHGDEPTAVIQEIRRRGDWLIWKGIRARSMDDIRRVADACGNLVDGFLLEGWKEGVIGGAGVKLALDPRVIREPLPSEAHFILAGGLTPENVADAAVRFQPDVLDVSSGVESLQGCKDPELMRRFIEVARASRQYDSGVTSLSRGGDIR
ncbi:MAG TPA: phosphoribosylanthranilate isomerase [Gemmatimonadetes bacterium]|nr:phosphoribosylanthranilate isomerase [Gemmatimonadota bacterium]